MHAINTIHRHYSYVHAICSNHSCAGDVCRNTPNSACRVIMWMAVHTHAHQCTQHNMYRLMLPAGYACIETITVSTYICQGRGVDANLCCNQDKVLHDRGWLQPLYIQGFAKWLSWTSFDSQLAFELWPYTLYCRRVIRSGFKVQRWVACVSRMAFARQPFCKTCTYCGVGGQISLVFVEFGKNAGNASSMQCPCRLLSSNYPWHIKGGSYCNAQQDYVLNGKSTFSPHNTFSAEMSTWCSVVQAMSYLMVICMYKCPTRLMLQCEEHIWKEMLKKLSMKYS